MRVGHDREPDHPYRRATEDRLGTQDVSNTGSCMPGTTGGVHRTLEARSATPCDNGDDGDDNERMSKPKWSSALVR